MNWNRYIQLQCERTQPGLFEEPFNTVSGLLFFVAAYVLWNILKKQTDRPFSLKFMIVMIAVIGAGSMTYHTVSRMWAAAFADVLPIAIMACVLMYVIGKHILRLHILGGLVLITLFVIANVWYKSHYGRGPDGYVSLMPSLLLMFPISIHMFLTRNPSFINFSVAAMIAALAVTFRILDNVGSVCDALPMGTHFLWHSFMALFFFIIVREAIKRHRIYDSI